MVTVQVGKDIDVYFASGADYNGLVGHKFASGIKVGFANIMSYSIEHNVERYMAPGRRYGWGIKGGGIECEIHLEGLWVDSGAQQFFLNESERSGSLTAFAIGGSGTERGVAFSGCRLGSIDVEFDAEGWATESVDIPALLPV